MTDISDEVLMAYADGELDASGCARVETYIAEDHKGVARLAVFTSTGRSLGMLYDEPMRQPAPQRLIETVLNSPLPAPGSSAIVLPFDSSISIGMRCSNWGVPKDATAMISTDSGAWVIKAEEKGKVFLRVTVNGAKVESEPGFGDQAWFGQSPNAAMMVAQKGARAFAVGIGGRPGPDVAKYRATLHRLVAGVAANIS